jgi:hypothetical protein
MGVPQCSTMVQQWFNNNGSTTMVQQQWFNNNGSTTMVNNNPQQPTQQSQNTLHIKHAPLLGGRHGFPPPVAHRLRQNHLCSPTATVLPFQNSHCNWIWSWLHGNPWWNCCLPLGQNARCPNSTPRPLLERFPIDPLWTTQSLPWRFPPF